MRKKTRAESKQAKLKKVDKVSLNQTIKSYLSFRNPITRFCLLFLALLVVFSLLLSLELIKHYFYDPVTTLVASQAAWVLTVKTSQIIGPIPFSSPYMVDGKFVCRLGNATLRFMPISITMGVFITIPLLHYSFLHQALSNRIKRR